ncbi:MAG TPA: TRAFs-binding domain-containing protein [Candidatus Acidoferrales bacterium]|jgi:tetratricopeptide (TPR) repeat protein|nr:TRAFs-binding domain-containing protein [Candidatus Acidoferrales bacterium]
MKPLCFVLMPFGKKTDGAGRVVDFDEVYKQLIAPAVKAADLDAIRADEEQVGGSIHKPMFERLMLCDYALADLTGANPNVYYELGIRHAVRPRSTIIIFAGGTPLPFDIANLRGLPYQINSAGVPVETEPSVEAITARFRSAREEPGDDSPLFQLIDGMPRIEVDHAKTDIFRERVQYSKDFKRRLADARAENVEAVRAIAQGGELANLNEVEAGTVIDLFLSFRDMKAYQDMVDLHARMPKPLQHSRLVREQLGLALNRLGKWKEAEEILLGVIKDYGESSETNALLGRIYKDRWDAARTAGQSLEARGLLKRAVAAYLAGFEADWRDCYPGINAVTLMEMMEPPHTAQADLLPVVRYAALRRIRTNGDYWDYATLLELEILCRNPDAAMDAAASALSLARYAWELETTARNLRLIRETRQRRGEDVAWIEELETQLAAAKKS